MTAAVSLRAVRVGIGARVVLDLPGLEIAAGERVALVGANGAGKSTLLRLVAGQLRPREGQIEVLGRMLSRDGVAPVLPAASRRALRRETGLLMQGLHLVPRLSARENVLIGALGRLDGADAWRSLLRWYPAELVAQADAALAALGLADRADTRTDRLSGGERQKVALARLRLQRPRLVLADEPTSALDPAATRQACAALTALVDAPDRTLVTVVHDLALLPLLATRVIGLAGGRIQWDRPLSETSPAMLQALYDAAPPDAARPAAAPQGARVPSFTLDREPRHAEP